MIKQRDEKERERRRSKEVKEKEAEEEARPISQSCKEATPKEV